MENFSDEDFAYLYPNPAVQQIINPGDIISCKTIVKLYIGNLDKRTTKSDIENLFANYYTTSIWIARKPPGFGFVHMDNMKEAEKAVAQLNDKKLRGKAIKVEISNSHNPEPINSR